MAAIPIERGKVREYSTATAAARPAYLDDPKAVIPPTFLVTVTFWAQLGHSVRNPDVARACSSVGITADVRHLLSLEQEYIFHGPPPRVGDTLQISEHFRDVRINDARIGLMVVVRFTVSFRDNSGAVRAECLYTSAFVKKEGACRT